MAVKIISLGGLSVRYYYADSTLSSQSSSIFYYYLNDPDLDPGWREGSSTAFHHDFVSRIVPPTQSGYTFGGFYSGNVCCINEDGTFAISVPTTDYATTARWNPITYTLTFNPNGGTVEQQSKNVSYNSAIGSMPTPVLEGMTFAGWYTSVSGGTQVTDETVYSWANNQTVYAHWDPLPVLTFNANGGTVTPSSRTQQRNQPIGDLPVPSYSGFRFGGWYTESVGGNLVTSQTSYSWSGDKTIYAHWISPRTLTFNANGGNVSPSSKQVFIGDEIGDLPIPEKAGYYFDGWHWSLSENDPIDSSDVYTWDSDKTAYAHWSVSEQYILSFNANGGSVSPTSKYVQPNVVIGEMPTPVLYGHTFLGWFTNETSGEEYVSSDVFDLHEDLMLFAHWSRNLFTIQFNANGGSVSPSSKIVTKNTAIGDLPTPTKYANTFLGWFTESSGGSEWTSQTVFSLSDDVTIFAHWIADPSFVRTANLDANGGTVVIQSVQCTYGIEIGNLPIPSNGNMKFVGWFSTSSVGGVKYTSDSICDWSGSKTLYARWVDIDVGVIDDWFSLASNNLIPIESDSGDNKIRVCVCNATGTGASQSNAGRYSQGVNHVGGTWRNPTVKYRVVGDVQLSVVLGKAFLNRGSNISGYMITEVDVRTAIGEFPTVTVRSVANEGADAINLFTVSLNIYGNAHAQNLMSAISGGGILQACSLIARADPVVCAENLMPCASDVVKGRIDVSAETIATSGESEPVAENGFTSIGEPKLTNDGVFPSYKINVKKEIV